MKIKQILKEYKDKLTYDKLHDIINILASIVEDNDTEQEESKLLRKINCIVLDGHYNSELALEDINKMYYTLNGKKFNAPYWPVEEVMGIYNSLKNSNPILSVYNFYDFYVALNMIKSDNYKLYKTRFKNYSEEELDKLFIEDTINWLDDDDNPYGNHKIFGYLSK